MWIHGLRSGPPASSNKTRTAGSADSRLASTQPAEPAPTMTKSNSSVWSRISRYPVIPSSAQSVGRKSRPGEPPGLAPTDRRKRSRGRGGAPELVEGPPLAAVAEYASRLGKNFLAAYSLATPAKAGVHASAAQADNGWYDIAIACKFRTVEKWVPAFAGTTMKECTDFPSRSEFLPSLFAIPPYSF